MLGIFATAACLFLSSTFAYAKIINKKKDDAIGLIDAEFANT